MTLNSLCNTVAFQPALYSVEWTFSNIFRLMSKLIINHLDLTSGAVPVLLANEAVVIAYEFFSYLFQADKPGTCGSLQSPNLKHSL